MTAQKEARLRARIRQLQEAGAALGQRSPTLNDRELEVHTRSLQELIDRRNAELGAGAARTATADHAGKVHAAATTTAARTTTAEHDGQRTMDRSPTPNHPRPV